MAKEIKGNVQENTVADASAKTTSADRNNAYKALLDWITAQENVPSAVMEAAKAVRPSYFGIAFSRGTGDGLNPAYRRLLALNNGTTPEIGTSWDEKELFLAHKFGRTEARDWCKELIKYTCEQPRAWVQCDINTAGERIYTLVAVQDTVPEGWKGYIPAELTADGKSVPSGSKK